MFRLYDLTTGQKNHLWARSPSIKVSVLTQCSYKSTPPEHDKTALMIFFFSAMMCKHHTEREIKGKSYFVVIKVHQYGTEM